MAEYYWQIYSAAKKNPYFTQLDFYAWRPNYGDSRSPTTMYEVATQLAVSQEGLSCMMLVS
jgi:hypothetical protein